MNLKELRIEKEEIDSLQESYYNNLIKILEKSELEKLETIRKLNISNSEIYKLKSEIKLKDIKIQQIQQQLNEVENKLKQLERINLQNRDSNKEFFEKDNIESIDIGSFQDKYKNLLNVSFNKSILKDKKLFRDFLKDEVILNNLSLSKKIQLLFIAYLYNLDREFLRVYGEGLDNRNNKAIELYYLIKSEAEKVANNKEYDTCVGKFIIQNKDELILEKDILDAIVEKNYKYFNEVEVLYFGEDICSKHKQMLQGKKVFINSYNELNHEKVIPISARYCSECNKVFINNKKLEKINKAHGKFKINTSNAEKEISSGNSKNKREENKNIENLNSNLIIEFNRADFIKAEKSVDSIKDSSINHQDFNSNNLNDESKLRKLGYSSSLTREERWGILTNRAIPVLGKKQIERHIEWLIKFNRNKSSMENALHEWQYDLNKLRKN